MHMNVISFVKMAHNASPERLYGKIIVKYVKLGVHWMSLAAEVDADDPQ